MKIFISWIFLSFYVLYSTTIYALDEVQTIPVLPLPENESAHGLQKELSISNQKFSKAINLEQSTFDNVEEASLGLKILCSLFLETDLNKCTFSAQEHAFYVAKPNLLLAFNALGFEANVAARIVTSLELPSDSKNNLYLAPLPQLFFNRLVLLSASSKFFPTLFETDNLSSVKLLEQIKISLRHKIAPVVFLADRSAQIRHAFILRIHDDNDTLTVLSDVEEGKFFVTDISTKDLFESMSLVSVIQRLKNYYGKIPLIFNHQLDMKNAIEKAHGSIVSSEVLNATKGYNFIIWQPR